MRRSSLSDARHSRLANHPDDFSLVDASKYGLFCLPTYLPIYLPTILNSLFRLSLFLFTSSSLSFFILHLIASLSFMLAAQFALTGLMLLGIMLIPFIGGSPRYCAIEDFVAREDALVTAFFHPRCIRVSFSCFCLICFATTLFVKVW